MTKGEIINAIYKANLTKRATLVVFYLINRANKEMTCFPGVKTIAKECNMSTRTVQRALNDLVESGFLKKESRFHEQGGQRSNLYVLMIAENQGDKTCDENVTFDSYIKDRGDDKKEERVDGVESNKEEISPSKEIINKIKNVGSKDFSRNLDNVIETSFTREKNHSIDYCRGS